MWCRVIASSKLIYVVPGYGMAVSQAQKEVAKLADVINESSEGRECRYSSLFELQLS